MEIGLLIKIKRTQNIDRVTAAVKTWFLFYIV